ncbi:porin family protein [Flavobacterium sp.]|uniref:porin family protein n=1 Tax=Flavobacterium sp. TaxID=239 RepID=UPI003B98E8EA
MKKLCIIGLLAFSSFIQAQTLDFGVKGGANFSNVNGDNIESSIRTSFYVGAFAEVSLFENLSIQPEVLYSSQGASVDSGDDFNLDYINVPILAKFYLTSKTFSIEVGPQFGLLVNDNVENQFETETFDFSAIAGLGYNITDNISAHARYVFGLTEASKTAEITNTTIQVGLGYKF